MDDYIYVDGELYHHGIKGMRWGVRRYQNKNGTLTAAGKKRYDKELEKAKNEARVLRNRQATANKIAKLEDMKARNKLKKDVLDGKVEPESPKSKSKTNSTSSNRPKTIKEMSNDEIRAKIERIELENRLQSLTPKEVSRGKKFISTLGNDILKPMLVSTGKELIGKYAEKKLGLGDDEMKKLERKSKIADYKKKIYESEMAGRKNRKEREKDEAESSSRSKNDDADSEFTKSKSDDTVYSGTVTGEGTSRRKTKSSPIYDASWKDVTVSSVPTQQRELGYNYVAALPEKKRKKK